MKKKSKSTLELLKETRNSWTINPVTRVHDNDLKKNKKKTRQDAKAKIQEASKE